MGSSNEEREEASEEGHREVKLTFEELTTVVAQNEACLNIRPLVPLTIDEEGLETLTPGHFLIGRAFEALPDSNFSLVSLGIVSNSCAILLEMVYQVCH